MKLLIVDDQELIRESLSIVLDMEPDIEVIGLAENGEKALKLCELKQPDVVLMDVRMPVMNGVEATKQIKQQWPHIRVIILTTFQEVEYVVDALSQGAEGYLLKAIHPKDLAAGIRLVWKGETLIPQDIAKILISQLPYNFPNETPHPKKEQSKFGLTQREIEILKYLAEGLHNREIAEKLYLSEGTVKNYISSIYSKLDVRDRLKAAKKAREKGIL